MLPDVSREALDLLTNDCVLKRKQPSVVQTLRDLLEKLTHAEPQIKHTDVHELFALGAQLEKTYQNDALDCIDNLVRRGKKGLSDLESVCEMQVSDLRSRGWSDSSLAELLAPAQIAATAITPDSLVNTLRESLMKPPAQHECYVAVTLEGIDPSLFSGPGPRFVDRLPAIPQGPPQPHGPFIAVDVLAYDTRDAASRARSRVASALGALAVFVKGNPEVRRTPIVTVARDGQLTSIDTTDPLPKEKRFPDPNQLKRVLSSALSALEDPRGDPIFDAIRHYDRAMNTPDPESRFMLFWLGIERLCSGTYDHGTILSAARSLVPKAIVLGKMRREVGALAAALEQELSSVESRKSAIHELVGGFINKAGKAQIDRQKLLACILGGEGELKLLFDIFYETHVHLVQWIFRLRKRLLGQSASDPGGHIAGYLEQSRQRVEWHILRLYRARNSVAHAGHGPAWLRDLIRHAHDYLTQLIAIVIHYRESNPRRHPSEILVERVGQYDAYIQLLRGNHAHALRADVLLRPTKLLARNSV